MSIHLESLNKRVVDCDNFCSNGAIFYFNVAHSKPFVIKAVQLHVEIGTDVLAR